jgi:hypothetical protein
MIAPILDGCNAPLVKPHPSLGYRRPDENGDQEKLTTHVETYTGVTNLFFLYFSLSGAKISVAPAAHRSINFVPLTRGQLRNWHWKISADVPLVPLYRRMVAQTGFGWQSIFGLLRQDVKTLITKHPPPIHFSIQMVPRMDYSRQCVRIRFEVRSLCYAFPFPTADPARNQSAFLRRFMGAISFLAHEVANNFPVSWNYSGAITEARAFLFSNYVIYLQERAMKIYRPASKEELPAHRKEVCLRTHVVHLSKHVFSENPPSVQAEILGGQIAILITEKAFGGNREICAGDRTAVARYQTLVRKVFQHPSILHRLERKAREILFLKKHRPRRPAG